MALNNDGHNNDNNDNEATQNTHLVDCRLAISDDVKLPKFDPTTRTSAIDSFDNNEQHASVELLPICGQSHGTHTKHSTIIKSNTRHKPQRESSTHNHCVRADVPTHKTYSSQRS